MQNRINGVSFTAAYSSSGLLPYRRVVPMYEIIPHSLAKVLERIVDHHTPCYVNEHQSVLRGIKSGWYAMQGDGSLSFGPFFNRETCLSRIDQLMNWSASSKLRGRAI